MALEKIVEVTSPRDDPSTNISASFFGSHISLYIDDLKLTAHKQCLIINKFVNEDVTWNTLREEISSNYTVTLKQKQI